MLTVTIQGFAGKLPFSAPSSHQPQAAAACAGRQVSSGACLQAALAPAVPLPAAVVAVGDGVEVSSASADALPARITLTFDAATLPEPVSADSMDRLAVLALQDGQWIECQRLALHLHMRAPFDSHVDVMATRPGYYAVVYRRPAKGIAAAKDRPAKS